MQKKTRRRTGLGLALGLGAAAVLAGGTGPAPLEAEECGGFEGPVCEQQSLCAGWWILKYCHERYTYYPAYAPAPPPDEGGTGPIGF